MLAGSDSNSQNGKKLPQISRDEMNLAEFPLTVLSTRVNPKVKTLEFNDNITTKAGKTLKRSWIITGADKFGLPTSSDDEVLLGLLKLSVEDGLEERKVYFTRYELLRILKWTTEGRSYTRLQNALDRLSGVRIKATNAFFDNETKGHSTKNFGIIDAYEINDGRDAKPKPSFFIWSEELFNSFRSGFIKKLDLDFYLDLKSAISKRLFRYLDKHFWYKTKVRINLFTLAHEKLGVSRNYKYASSLKQQIDPAISELIEEGFLTESEYEGRGKGTEIILTAALDKPRSVGGKAPSNQLSGQLNGHLNGEFDKEVGNQKEPKTVEKQGKTVTARVEDLESIGKERLLTMLIKRGIEPQVARRLVSKKNRGEQVRIEAIISHYDLLVETGSNRVSKNRTGFLFWAVTNFEKYVLPDEDNGQRDKGQNGESSSSKSGKRGVDGAKQLDLLKESNLVQSEYQKYRVGEVARIKALVDDELLEKIQKEVIGTLNKVKKSISKDSYEKAVSQQIDDRLAKLFAVPTFDEWKESEEL